MKHFTLDIKLYFLETDKQTNETFKEILMNCSLSKEISALESIWR